MLAKKLRTLSVASKWLTEADSRLDATSYAEGSQQVLEQLDSFGLPLETLGSLCGTLWHPVQRVTSSDVVYG